MKEEREGAVSASRRRVLKGVAMGTGLAVLPGAGALAAASSGYAPSICVGYCSLAAISDRGMAVYDASAVKPVRGNYELSVIGASTNAPLAISAQYGFTASHTFWQAWQARGILQRSPPITIRWSAMAMNALPLTVSLANGSGPAQVTAREGIYALIVAPASSPAPSWFSLLLKPVSSGGVSMRLLSRLTGAELALPYVLFSVQSGDAVNTA